MRRLPALEPDLDPAEVVAAVAPVLGEERAARLDRIAGARLVGLACVLEELHDPHNAGAALRSCEATGVLRVHAVAGREVFRTPAKITQGCERWLDLSRHDSLASCLERLDAGGYRLYAAVPGASLSIFELPTDGRVALAFGNEHAGLSPALRDRAAGEFSIPLHGASQSLNVSVSVAVSLFVHAEARRKVLGRPGDLDERELLELRARYYASEVRSVRALLARR